MKQLFVAWLRGMRVSRKLALIYALDLAAIVVVTGFLVHEKYLAIDVARAEIDGIEQILPLQRELVAAESREALQAGRTEIRTIGNNSQLILDPELPSYYTMSLVVLRFPELLLAARDISDVVRLPADLPVLRAHYLVADGQLEAASQGLVADYEEAFIASPPGLLRALAPDSRRLVEKIQSLRMTAQAYSEGRADAASVRAAQHDLLAMIAPAWADCSRELADLLRARVNRLEERMALHLGVAAVVLLAALLLVITVARQIAVPLRELADLADAVRRSGDHRLRMTWDGRDEIGRLVRAFVEMLEQLDRERKLQLEHAARARAAQAEQAVVEATPTPLVVTTAGGHAVLHANPQARAWLDDSGDPWKRGLEPAVRERFFRQLEQDGAVDEFEAQWRSGDEQSWAMLSARRMRYQGQDAVIATFSPINQLKLLEMRLALWGRVFEASTESIVIVDHERRILMANPSFYRATGFSVDEVADAAPESLLSRDEPPSRLDSIFRHVDAQGSWQGELRLRRADGTDYPAWLLASPVRGGGQAVTHVILTSLDISDRKKSEERMRFLAEHDVLTQLPNRALCATRLRQAIERAAAASGKVAALFVDLDDFKIVNDSLGHHVGDGLLRLIAQALVGAVRKEDIVCRLGGDEFVIVMEGISGSDEVARVIERQIVPAIRGPHDVQRHHLTATASIGVSLYPDHGQTVEDLMRTADTSMYLAKSSGGDGIRFSRTENVAVI